MSSKKQRFRHAPLGRKLAAEQLEERLALSVSLADLQAAGISQRVVDYIDNIQFETEILGDAALENTLVGLNSTQTAPADATVLNSVASLSQITAGTPANPNVYLIQGDLQITNTIQVPSNVHIYVDGSIFKQGSFTAPGGVHSVENTGANADAIFRLNGSDNVKLIGVNNALLHSTPNLDVNSPHTTAIFIHSNSSNVEVEGFEIAFVWNGVAAHPFNIDDVTVTNNYIHDTLDRAIWSLGTDNFRAAHNFIENPGIDGLDWDAFTDNAISYENVVIGAGRWAGFVEEGTEDSYFVRGLGILADFGNPNRGFMLGWADNGSSPGFVNNNPNPSQWTEHNYFIDNVIFDPGGIPNSGGDYFAKNNAGKGPTYFWANRGFGAGQSANNFDNAEWLTFLPTAGGRNNAVNAVQLLADLDAEFNNVQTIALSAPPLAISEFAPIDAIVGAVTPQNANVEDLTFSITAGNDGDAFAIDDSGVIAVAAPLDFETQPSYVLTVEATDGVLTGTTGVSIEVESPFSTVVTLFDHDFSSPDFFNAADVRGQQGWGAQNGWAVTDAAGQGFATSSTTAFQGVTNNAQGDIPVGDTIRIVLDFTIDVNLDVNSDQFRFGVTTLDGGGNFIPSLGNNGGSIVSGKLTYVAATDSIDFVVAEGEGVSLNASAANLGLNLTGGDGQTDDLRITWEATKSDTSGQWDVTLQAENLTTGADFGEQSVTTTESTAYQTSTGLFAGFRGLQNNTASLFNIDRISYQIVTPGSAIPGDYNFDGAVDAADYTVWRDSLGNMGGNLPADGDGNGAVDNGDYAIWRNNYGTTAATATVSLARAGFTPTPTSEPTTPQSAPLVFSLAAEANHTFDRSAAAAEARQSLSVLQNDDALLLHLNEVSADALNSLVSDPPPTEAVDGALEEIDLWQPIGSGLTS